MIEYLETHAIFAKLNNMLKNARQFIYIVSPFINLSDGEQLMYLQNAAKKGVSITIVFRLGHNQTQKELKQLSDLPGIRIIGCPELHAKIYATEDAAILSSRNLTTRQEGCSIEVGVLFDSLEETYDELINSANNLACFSESKIIWDNSDKQPISDVLGYCIRCREQIPLNVTQPLCVSCMRVWSNFRDPNYPERFCHFCGKESDDISFGLPMEYNCYQQYLTLPKPNSRFLSRFY